MVDNRRMLEEAAVEYHERIDYRTGKVERVGIVNRSRLMELRRQMAATGREVLEPFRDWLIESEGKSDSRADQVLALAWTAMWETSNEPWQKLYRTDIAWRQRMVLRGALRLFASWLLNDRERSLEEREFGRKLVDQLNTFHPGRQTLRDKRQRKDHPRVEPLPEEQIKLLLTHLKSRHYRIGGKYPWAHSCGGAVIKTAARPSELVWITKDQVDRAYHDLQDGNEATISIWGQQAVARVIPATLIAEEIHAWYHWPSPWQTIADIVAARYSSTNKRPARAALLISQQLRKACDEAGIEYDNGKQLSQALRWASVKRLYRQYGSHLAVQQITGVTVERMRGLAWLEED